MYAPSHLALRKKKTQTQVPQDAVVRGVRDLQAAVGAGARWEELAGLVDVLTAVCAAAIAAGEADVAEWLLKGDPESAARGGGATHCAMASH